MDGRWSVFFLLADYTSVSISSNYPLRDPFAAAILAVHPSITLLPAAPWINTIEPSTERTPAGTFTQPSSSPDSGQPPSPFPRRPAPPPPPQVSYSSLSRSFAIRGFRFRFLFLLVRPRIFIPRKQTRAAPVAPRQTPPVNSPSSRRPRFACCLLRASTRD